jgi:hypothetical protein
MVRFPVGAGIFLFTTASRPSLGSASYPVSTGETFLRVKRLDACISLMKEEKKDINGQREAVGYLFTCIGRSLHGYFVNCFIEHTVRF